jgi:superfamily II DNA or RNA helicase
MQLRPYQIEAKKKIYAAFREHNRVMFQLPTGGGKTVMMSDICKDIRAVNKTAFILVHREELITQTAHKLQSFGLDFGVIQSKRPYNHFAKLQIVSVPTLSRRLAKPNSIPKHCDVIITDEAHHATADTYRAIYNHYSDAKLLGVSATPVRRNGQGFSDIFDTLVCGVSVKHLIEIGSLVKPKIFAPVNNLDFKSVKKSKGDFDVKSAFEFMESNVSYGSVVETWQDKANNEQTIVFAVNVEHSMHIVDEYKKNGINAVHIDAKTHELERARIIKAFRNGEIKILSNVGILTEGFDVPNIGCVQLLRPTQSLSLYLQMVGRGLRPIAGKSQAIILDHVEAIKMHGLPEQDRLWSLDGVRKAKSDTVVMARDNEGRIYDPNSIPENLSHVELIEITHDPYREKYMLDSLATANKMGFQRLWAWHNFKKKYPIPTKEEIKKFESLAGFKRGWAYVIMKEMNYV